MSSSPGFILSGGNACGSKKSISLSSWRGSGELSKNEIFPAWAGWMDGKIWGWQWLGEGEMWAWGTAWHRLWELPYLRSTWHWRSGELWPRLDQGKDQMQFDGQGSDAIRWVLDSAPTAPFFHCTVGQKFPKIPPPIYASFIFHQAQTNT